MKPSIKRYLEQNETLAVRSKSTIEKYAQAGADGQTWLGLAHVFLDESGQFNKKTNERYFVIASFTVGDPKRTHKNFKSWCVRRFPKAMRNQSEIKFSDSGIDKNLKLRTLCRIAKMDVRIFYTYLDCQS